METTQRILPEEFIARAKRLCPRENYSRLHDLLDRNAKGDEDSLFYIQRQLSEIGKAAENTLTSELVLEMLDAGKHEELRRVAQDAADRSSLFTEYVIWFTAA